MGWIRSPDSVSPVGIYNDELIAFASAARTATVNSEDLINRGARGVMLTLDVTATTDTPSIVLKVQHKDPASGKYETLGIAGAVTAVGTHTYVVHPECAAAGDITAVVNYLLGHTWRVRIEHGDADPITYSVGGCHLP